MIVTAGAAGAAGEGDKGEDEIDTAEEDDDSVDGILSAAAVPAIAEQSAGETTSIPITHGETILAYKQKLFSMLNYSLYTVET